MIIGSFVFILLLAASSFVVARATRQLTPEQKGLVAENSSSSTGWMMVAIAVLYGLDVAYTHFFGFSRESLLVLVVSIFVLGTAFAVVQQRRLERLDLPLAYRRSYYVGMLLTQLGMLTVFTSIYYGPYQLLGR